jgi:CO/xanthine dehydrogenase Mo-binding subunit
VLTIDQALDPSAPLVQDPSIRAGQALAHTNILQEWRFGWGDADVHAADCVIENDYTFPMVTHFAIEPHVFLAAPDQNGITIWSPIQHPYVLQRVVASALRMPVSKVRIISPDPGGGFGGKGWPKFEPLMAFLALKTGRPVSTSVDAGRDLPAGPPGIGANARCTGSISRVTSSFRTSRRLPDRCLCGRRWTRRQQGQLRGVRPACTPHA